MLAVWLLSCPPALADFDYNTASRSVVTVFCESSKSLGGGVIIARSSIVSMLHVTSPCRQVILGYYDGTFTLGMVTETDDTRDLALIRPERLPDFAHPVHLDTTTPDIGDRLHTISHLNGMPWTYSPATTTFPGERIVDIANHKFSVLVVNTPAFAGSSGGALFNDEGHVIGFAKGSLFGTSIAYFIPSGAVCKHLIKCKTGDK